jgi:hypothetical protein
MLGALPLRWTKGRIHRLKEEANFRLKKLIVAEGLLKDSGFTYEVSMRNYLPF